MSIFKRCSLVFFCLFMLIPSFLFSVSALDTDYSFEVNYPNPIDIGYDGFFTVPYTDGTTTHLQVVYWKFFHTNSINSTNSEAGQDPIVRVNFKSPTTFDIQFDYFGTDPIAVYVNTISTQNPKAGTGAWDVINYSESYILSYGHSLNTYCWSQLHSGVLEITSDSNYLSRFPFNSYNVIWSNNDTYKELGEILSHLDSMLSEMQLTNEQLTSIVNKFDELLEISQSTNDMLGEFIYYYWENFVLWDFPQYISSINARLDNIYRLLNKQGDVEQTTVDTSKIDQFADVEQSLLNNDEAQSAIGDMDISIDGQAYSFIWELVTKILNTHPEVFGLVITILTLGFIALLLNR